MPTPRSPSELQNTAAQWVARRNNGESSAEDQRAFLLWINASDSHRRAYEQAESLWERMRNIDEIADRQLAEARAYREKCRKRPGRQKFVALAAALLLATGLLWYSDLLSHLNEQTYRTALGERKKINLPDGSQLELNTHSEATVHYSRRSREIRLIRGQAVFTVAHDDSRPFDVLAGGGRIRDIGTQFDVRLMEDRVSVAVLDGEIEISGNADAVPTRRLQRGLRLSYTRAGELTAPQPIDLNTVSAWREGQLVFRGQALKEVLEELGRYHPAGITVSTPQILDTRVSGTFPTDNLPLALHTMAAALPIKLTQTGPQHWRIDRR